MSQHQGLDAAALRAATLSFAKNLPSSRTRSTSKNITPTTSSSRAATRTPARTGPAPRSPQKTPDVQGRSSPSALAARIAFSRSPFTSSLRDTMANEEETLPSQGTVHLRRQLFQDNTVAGNGSPPPLPKRASPPPLHRISPERSRPGSPGKATMQVDSAPIEDISSLKSMFEKNKAVHKQLQQSPNIYAPKPIRLPNSESLTAAVLATQLSPSRSGPPSRRQSPSRQESLSPTRRSPVHRATASEGSGPVKKQPQIQTVIKKKPVPPVKPIMLRSIASHESIVASPSSNNNTQTQSSALATANITHSNGASFQPLPTILVQQKQFIGPKQQQLPPLEPTQPTPEEQKHSTGQVTKPTGRPQPPPPRRKPLPETTKPLLEETTISSTAPSFYIPTEHPAIFNQTPLIANSKPVTGPGQPPPLPSRAPAFSFAPTPSTLSQTSTTSLPPPLPTHTNAPSPAQTAAILSYKVSTTPLPIRPTRTGDSVTAAALAPGRMNTPGLRKPSTPVFPPPPRRVDLKLQRRKSLPSSTTSPPKQSLSKQTLRPPRPRSRSPSPTKPHAPLLLRPSHHNEAAQHAWRQAVTEKERKLYEGLWAANRGLLMDRYHPRLKDCVANIVVADIWRRSRLHPRVLAEIYGLVDRHQMGWLDREEFVVGTWLVDQSLRGKKCPVRVEDTVWDSVRLRGVPPPPPPRGRAGVNQMNNVL